MRRCTSLLTVHTCNSQTHTRARTHTHFFTESHWRADIRSHQRLAACVRKVKPCHWLTQMAHQVGFTREDIDKYRHRKHSFTVACRGGSALKPIDFSSPSLVDASSDGTLTRGGTEVSRSRSVPRSQQRVVGRKHTQPWLLPVVSCTVVEEPKEKSKSHPRLQMFTNVSNMPCTP